MATNKTNKTFIYLYIICIIAGCVLACSSLITNDYLKLVIVMVSLGIGLFGVMKQLSGSDASEEKAKSEE